MAFDGLIVMPAIQLERVIRALLANIADWEERLREVESHAPSDNGNRQRCLTLLRDMGQAKHSLRRLSGIDPDEGQS